MDVEIDNAAETGGRIEEACGSKVQARDVELGIERSERGVRFIHGADGAVQLELAAGRQTGGDFDGKFRGDGNVGGGDIDVVVGATLLRIRGDDADAAGALGEVLVGIVGVRIRRAGGFHRV